MVISHLLACMFWIWPALFYGPDEVTWRNDADGGLQLLDASSFAQYTMSLYWAITTMTTIGYGDITPSREYEILFTIFAQLIGVSFFALLVTQINELNDVVGGGHFAPRRVALRFHSQHLDLVMTLPASAHRRMAAF